jgi:hypothetical protein
MHYLVSSLLPLSGISSSLAVLVRMLQPTLPYTLRTSTDATGTKLSSPSGAQLSLKEDLGAEQWARPLKPQWRTAELSLLSGILELTPVHFVGKAM